MIRPLLTGDLCPPHQHGVTTDPDLPGVLSVCQRHPFHLHRHAHPPLRPTQGNNTPPPVVEGWSESWLHLPGKHPTNKLPCCIEWSLTLSLSDSTSTRGAANWSWGQEHYKWWDSRPSPLKTWVCTRSWSVPNLTGARREIPRGWRVSSAHVMPGPACICSLLVRRYLEPLALIL